MNKPVYVILIILVVLAVVISLYLTLKKRKIKRTYSKQCLMTNTELKYYTAFRSILSGTPYYLHFQTPLSAIVKRNEKHNVQPELSRVIDFCILSPELCPLLCIEINDQTHKLKHRVERDEKVKQILKSAKIPLLTVWTDETFDVKVLASKIKDNGVKIDLRRIYNEYKR